MKATYIAKYIINEMNNINEEITQLKLQKLLYFTEAYYMAVYNKKELFIDKFYAWTYGPVCKTIYDEYRIYSNLPILSDETNLQSIDEKISESIKIICNLFGKRTATELIRLTHMKNSPWYNTTKNSKSCISKEETKKWFLNNFING